ncbi:hypothetical protein [Kribbella catacumbae]|uniref:hypothetical protein n=1 Tax=Kribbella catacumbae TaxID=460086 RepID=UPI00146E3559|nr:hypothetical protein [Kribbella catacumbae]
MQPASIDDEQLKARMQALLDHCELANIRLIEFSAKRHEGSAEPVDARLSSEVSFVVGKSFMANRFTWQLDLADGEGATVAELAATFVVDYEILDGFEPDDEAADAIAGNTGFFAAYPYARELFQSHTARLQLNPLVLGMLLRGASQPRAVTAVKVSSAAVAD